MRAGVGLRSREGKKDIPEMSLNTVAFGRPTSSSPTGASFSDMIFHGELMSVDCVKEGKSELDETKREKGG